MFSMAILISTLIISHYMESFMYLHIKTFRCFNSKALSFDQSEANENEKALGFLSHFHF